MRWVDPFGSIAAECQLMPAVSEFQFHRLRINGAYRVGGQLIAQVLASVQRFEMQRVGNDNPAVLAISAGDALEKFFIIAKGRWDFDPFHVTSCEAVEKSLL